MNETFRQHPARRPVLAAAPAILAGLALAFAFVAGCGGSGSSSETSGTNSGSTSGGTPPPATGTPTPSSEPALTGAALGAKVFDTRCALCHGPQGHGDGPGSVALKPKPRNLHDAAYMSTRTDAQLLEVIHQGKGAMPKWGGVLTEAEITAVLGHVRELGKAH